MDTLNPHQNEYVKDLQSLPKENNTKTLKRDFELTNIYINKGD